MSGPYREMRLLFVDDEELARKAFVRSVVRRGYQVDLAASGDEAIQIAREYFYPVIVTDLRMPGLDGFSLIERLKPLQPSSVFVIVTAFPDLDRRASQSHDPAIACTVAKPWDDIELSRALDRAFKTHQERVQKLRDSGAPGLFAKTVLLIEDNPAHSELVSGYLSEQSSGQYQVRSEKRLGDALGFLHDHDCQAVIAGFPMQGADLLAVVGEIHAAAPRTPIIILSPAENQATAALALQLGAQDYLVRGDTDAKSLHRSIRYAMGRKRAEQRLAQLAYYDQLTGLASQTTFREGLASALHRASRQKTRLGVMLLGLDGLKRINRDLGHQAGDHVLQVVGKRLQAAVRAYDIVARLGGDEFALLVEELSRKSIHEQVAKRLLDAVAEPLSWRGARADIKCSIGVAVYPHAGETSENLLRSARQSMRDAKNAGGNRYEASRTRRVAAKPPSLAAALRQAIERNQFVLHYQPQVRLSDNQVVALEALLRWQKPDGSLVPPLGFITALEQTRLILRVGEWVLRTACEQLRRWRQAGYPELAVAVNLSPTQLERPGLAQAVSSVLEEAEIPPTALELQIKERMLMSDTPSINMALLQLKDIGVRIAVDDFGTGYSSLTRLQRFSVDSLRIDRSFAKHFALGSDDASVAVAIIKLAHELSLRVIAQGVETEELLSFLKDNGCDVAQGFIFGRPSATWPAPEHPE